ncbi:glycoside hydrolase, chitinase active site protein [Purpureocillium lavendulum]|uniref:chitinase n=1 Tax=Purpureocillium lavendulum TaxID=1247861 RepID=A0AB34FGR2_9HYPO|nr:glycoside hydrolase, chitinase active site protein [Purpureocillium lavendulum]
MPPLPPASAFANPLPRIITYYQTHHDASGKQHISLLPLLTQPSISVTHVMLAAIHLNDDPSALTLNDHPPSHPRFDTLWAELRVLQASGVRVLGMLGGAAAGSFARLDGSDAMFEAYYAPLRDMVRQRALDGLDLDVEEDMSLGGVIRLIDRLRADFGPAFIITLAPVAMAMLDAEKNLSGFDYEALEVLRGREIAWYNVQFYCNWGDASNTYMYDLMLGKGWPPEKIVIGLVTNPANGAGYVPWNMLSVVLAMLKRRHQQFGGVMGWEYFNGLPGGAERPWEWARDMTSVLRREALLPPPVEPPSQQPVDPPPIPPRPADFVTTAPREVEADPDETGGAAVVVPSHFDYYSDGSGGDA